MTWTRASDGEVSQGTLDCYITSKEDHSAFPGRLSKCPKTDEAVLRVMRLPLA